MTPIDKWLAADDTRELARDPIAGLPLWRLLLIWPGAVVKLVFLFPRSWLAMRRFYRKKRELEALAKAQRMDRIRHPEKYRGKD